MPQRSKLCISLFCLVILCLPAAVAPGLAADPVKKLAVPTAGKPASGHLAPVAVPVELVGEVVDSWCYASQVMGDGRGAHHQSCALACVMGGVTPGIVDDKGLLYLCVKHKAYTGCKDLLAPYVAKRVKVKGHLATKGGVRVLKVTSVELVK